MNPVIHAVLLVNKDHIWAKQVDISNQLVGFPVFQISVSWCTSIGLSIWFGVEGSGGEHFVLELATVVVCVGIVIHLGGGSA